MKKIVFLMSSTLLLWGCGGSSESKEGAANEVAEEVTEKVEEVKTCRYKYDHEKTELIWTAYKYNQKTGVKGTFDDISVAGLEGEGSVADIFNGAEITINTGSVNSGDPTRDPKIIEHFFGTLEGGESMAMSITNVTEDAITFNVKMNGQEKEVVANYTQENNALDVRAEIDVNSWGAQGGIDQLNEVCEDLHKGADGVSILWPDVSLLITTELVEICE